MIRTLLILLLSVSLFATTSYAQTSRTSPTSGVNDRIIKLYPNPATTNITFDLQKGYEKGMSIQIFSFLGKKMTDVANASPKTTIDLADYNRGLYMYHLLDASGKLVESGKFQVTK